MKKNFNYKKLYLEQYKNIPNFYFWGTMICGCVASIILGSHYFNLAASGYSSYAADGLLTLFGGLAATALLAFLNRWISSVAISQKVVVADTLLSMKDGSFDTAAEDEELPEL